MAELPKCPNCSGDLDPLVVPRGDTPPWNCAPCSRSWWDAELTSEARSAWDPSRRAYKSIGIMPAVMAERDVALKRSTSMSDKSLEFIPLEILERLRDGLPDPSTRRKSTEEAIVRKNG